MFLRDGNVDKRYGDCCETLRWKCDWWWCGCYDLWELIVVKFELDDG